jgi:O-acetyl-ADP-ribose deacetylase (regulator of RNase III)
VHCFSCRRTTACQYAFPCISTGVYGYSAETGGRGAIVAVREFLCIPRPLREVIFCCYSVDDLALYQARLA